jgi:pimeloyl-ACP methyl ester carboxylesterase
MPTTIANGVRISYVQIPYTGSGPVEDLIMVHGLATNLAFWYLQYAAEFATRFRVTLFDLRGHGRSEATETGYTPAELAADLEGLMDTLGIERAHFIAHSFGGTVALCLARRDRWRVASMILADSQLSLMRHVAEDSWAHGRHVQHVVDRAGLDLRVTDPHFGFKLLTAMAQLLLSGAEVTPEAAELVGPALGSCSRRTAKQWLDLMQQTRAYSEFLVDDGLSPEVLSTFSFPLLALYGDRSRPGSSVDLLRPCWPHARFQILSDAGHFFPASRSLEVIAECERFWDDIERRSFVTFVGKKSVEEVKADASTPRPLPRGHRAAG